MWNTIKKYELIRFDELNEDCGASIKKIKAIDIIHKCKNIILASINK